MRVRDGAVRGLDPHLRRLVDTSKELFTEPVDGPAVRELIRRALAGDRDASVRVTVFGTGRHGPPAGGPPDVLVSVLDPAPDRAQSPLRLRTAVYQRDFPHLKHGATMGQIRHWKLANADGFDDALFASPDGLVSEGTGWNLALWNGERVVWPDAPQLAGVTMQALWVALPAIGVPSAVLPVHRDDLPTFTGAAATNANTAAQPVASIDDTRFPATEELTERLRAAWDTVPWDAV